MIKVLNNGGLIRERVEKKRAVKQREMPGQTEIDLKGLKMQVIVKQRDGM